MGMMKETERLLADACERAKQRTASPIPFELKELFEQAEWKSLSSAVRRDLGRDFSYAVSQGKVASVRYVDENAKHHNTYLKS